MAETKPFGNTDHILGLVLFDQVKLFFARQTVDPALYNSFLEAFKEFAKGETALKTAITKIRAFLRGNVELLKDFDRFVPAPYRIQWFVIRVQSPFPF